MERGVAACRRSYNAAMDGERKMKRSASLLSLVVIVFCVCTASFPQASSATRRRFEFVTFERIEGFTDNDGAYLLWTTAVERGNFGFLVYRVAPSGLELVSNGLIPGSVTTSSMRPLYDGKYDYFDPAGRLDTAYVIVSRAADGRSVSTPSFSPLYTTDFLADT